MYKYIEHMNKQDVLKEIEGFENKSNFSNKKTIFLYQMMKIANNENSYLLMSLASALLSCYIFDISLMFGLIVHFLVWVTLRHTFINKKKYARENEGIDLIVSTIKDHLNKKSEN